MVVFNQINPYHVATSTLQKANRPDIPTSMLVDRRYAAIDSATAYACTHFEDAPGIRHWIWTPDKAKST